MVIAGHSRPNRYAPGSGGCFRLAPPPAASPKALCPHFHLPRAGRAGKFSLASSCAGNIAACIPRWPRSPPLTLPSSRQPPGYRRLRLMSTVRGPLIGLQAFLPAPGFSTVHAREYPVCYCHAMRRARRKLLPLRLASANVAGLRRSACNACPRTSPWLTVFRPPEPHCRRRAAFRPRGRLSLPTQRPSAPVRMAACGRRAFVVESASNQSVKPTRSGLRPPRAAYLQRWASTSRSRWPSTALWYHV